MKRHVFIASMGGAPQVITETLWALMHPHKLTDAAHEGREPVVAQVVHLLTTSTFNPKRYNSSQERDEEIREKIETLFRQYNEKVPEILIDTIPDATGAAMQDIRTQQENILYSDHVMRVLHDYVQDPNTVIHMSLAGGRKSMSSYNQSAMMCFGRLGDKLSHVLVDPDLYERLPDFWWPDQNFDCHDQDGKLVATDSEIARLDLVDVPFAPLGLRLPSGVPVEAMDARKIVEFAKFEQQGEPIIVDGQARTLRVGDAEIKLSCGRFALLTLMLVARKFAWKGAGPKEEGIGENTAGFIMVENVKYGLNLDGTPRNTKEILLLEALIRACPEYRLGGVREDDTDFLTNILSSKGFEEFGEKREARALGDPTSSKRTNLKKQLETAIDNPYVRERIVPQHYKKDNRGVFGIAFPPERIKFHNFPEDFSEKWLRYR